MIRDPATIEQMEVSFDYDKEAALEMSSASLRQDANSRGLDENFDSLLCRELGPGI